MRSCALATSTVNGRQVLALDDRQSRAARSAAGEVAAIVGRVQLAPEADVPAAGIAERRRA